MHYNKPYSSDAYVFEHGILTHNLAPPAQVRLVATGSQPIYSGFNVAIVDFEGNSLNERSAHLTDINGPHSIADYYQEYDLRYSALATLYHLNRLIDLYVENTQLFNQHHPVGSAVRGNLDDPRVYYETDAFLGAARRIYESLIRVLWKHYYAGSRGRWNSTRTAVKSLDKVPRLFATELQESWRSTGIKLADYRNCVAHYLPLTNGQTTCWFELFEEHWGMIVKLPANPEKKSRNFDFENGPDALTYCHSVANHLVDLCNSMMTQTKIAAYLTNPPRP
jgi:hypothetical protein